MADISVGDRAPASLTESATAVLPGLALVAVLAALAWSVSSLVDGLSPLVVGVAAGVVAANVVALPDRVRPGITFAARRVLRVGIVLLGLRLSLGDLAELGIRGLAVVALVVACTFFGTRWLGSRLGVPPKLGLLIATGYSICGASAIAAVDGVVRADEEETAYAITLVTLCGTLSIVLLPVLADPLGLSGDAFGSWAGGAVHDVGQVIATASSHGPSSLAAATVVKLTRVVLLAPLVAGVALAWRQRLSTSAGEQRPPVLPLFIIGFLAMIVVRTTGVLSDSTLDTAATVEKVLFTVALVGLGTGVRFDRIRRLGGRPLVLGMASWVLVAGVALIGTKLTH